MDNLNDILKDRVIKEVNTDGENTILIYLKPKERKLPKSWEEFCEMYPIKDGECYVSSTAKIEEYLYHRNLPRYIQNTNRLPDRATAEAVLALCQLIQLRNAFNGDWVPDWNDNNTKYIIGFYDGYIKTWPTQYTASVLFFKTEELRNEFLRYFRPLIEKIKPLYGIKEGGENE